MGAPPQFLMTMIWILPLDLCSRCQAVSRDREVWSRWHLLRLRAACAAMEFLMVKSRRLRPKMWQGRTGDDCALSGLLEGKDGKGTRAWKRRAQTSVANGEKFQNEGEAPERHGRKLEDDLGEHVLLHVQQEAERLHSQTQLLVTEIQPMKEEWENQPKLAVPPMSPQTFKCTPNRTRIPSGPPPPDPPPLPAWPPELGNYESAMEPPRKLRGVMGDLAYCVPECVYQDQLGISGWSKG